METEKENSPSSPTTKHWSPQRTEVIFLSARKEPLNMGRCSLPAFPFVRRFFPCSRKENQRYVIAATARPTPTRIILFLSDIYSAYLISYTSVTDEVISCEPGSRATGAMEPAASLMTL
jgi:hypothetical protein